MFLYIKQIKWYSAVCLKNAFGKQTSATQTPKGHVIEQMLVAWLNRFDKQCDRLLELVILFLNSGHFKNYQRGFSIEWANFFLDFFYKFYNFYRLFSSNFRNFYKKFRKKNDKKNYRNEKLQSSVHFWKPNRSRDTVPNTEIISGLQRIIPPTFQAGAF